jgi:hypothetical protein
MPLVSHRLRSSASGFAERGYSFAGWMVSKESCSGASRTGFVEN